MSRAATRATEGRTAESRKAGKKAAASKGAKLAYRPVGLIGGVLAGIVSGAVFKQVWKRVANEDEAPSALSRCPVPVIASPSVC